MTLATTPVRPAHRTTAEATPMRAWRRRGLRHPRLVATAAVAAVALGYVVAHDGSPAWRVVRVAAVAVAAWAVSAGLERAGTAAVGTTSIVFGLPVLAVGLGLSPFVVKDGPGAPLAAAAIVEVLAGLILLAAGIALSGRGRPLAIRVASGAWTVFVAAVVAWTVSPAVAATNVPRPAIGATPRAAGLAAADVRLHTSDGVELAGWYLPSSNRAAVVLLHGAGSTRSNVLDEARVLAGHGYGVLLVDARGHGESGGRAMDFGWHGDEDVAAATAYLGARPDVDRSRIAVVGLSMGGEEAIGASATDERIRAVVAEGATARTAGDEAWLSETYGWRGALQEGVEQVQDAVTDVLTSATVPVANADAVRAARDTRYLLIAAGTEPDEQHAAAHLRRAAPDRVRTWTVPGAAHTAGLETAPAAWEARVVAFLDETLRR